MDYPGNSHSSKEPPEEKPARIEKAISGKAIKRKTPLGKRLKEIFIGGDAESVLGYVAYDILIPAVKDTVFDVVSMGIERTLFGEARSTRRRGGLFGSAGTPNSYGYYNYQAASKGGRYEREQARPLSRRARASHDFGEIIIPTRTEAEVVIERMDDLIDRYRQVTVSDLYEMVGIESEYTDEKYGWTDLRSVSISRVHEGYLINLPRPEVL